MKHVTKNKMITLLIPLVAFLGFIIILINWNSENPIDNITHNSVEKVNIQSNEIASDQNSARMCAPANLPIDLTIDLLNDPQASGDIAFFEVKFTSRIDHEGLKAYLVLPDGAVKESGEDAWEGKLALNETRQIDAAIRLNTEAAISLKAIVEISRGDTSFTVGKSFQLDLGEKEHASLSDLAISGFEGADSLKIIVPAGS
jgi:hypothetical protein